MCVIIYRATCRGSTSISRGRSRRPSRHGSDDEDDQGHTVLDCAAFSTLKVSESQVVLRNLKHNIVYMVLCL